MFGVPRTCHSAIRTAADSSAVQPELRRRRQNAIDGCWCPASLSRHDAIGTRTRWRWFRAGGAAPRRRQVVGEHRGHEPLEPERGPLLHTPLGQHRLERLRCGLHGDRPLAARGDQIGVEVENSSSTRLNWWWPSARLWWTYSVGCACAVADCQRAGAPATRSGRTCSGGVGVVGRSTRPPRSRGASGRRTTSGVAVGPLFEMAAEHRVRLAAARRTPSDSASTSTGPRTCAAEADEVVRLGEHLLAARQLADHRRWKHFRTP